MISKELLCQVLNKKIDKIEYIKNKDYRVYYEWKPNGSLFDDINIYELAHRCKAWANKLEFQISTKPDLDEWVSVIYTPYAEELKIIRTTTEPEAIFQACEWILKENNG